MKQIITYLIEFVLGGGIIVGMDILARKVHPKFSALLYALPLQFTLAAIFIYRGTNKSTIQSLSVFTILSLLTLILFISVFYFLTRKFEFWTSLGISYGMFIVIGAIILYLS